MQLASSTLELYAQLGSKGAQLGLQEINLQSSQIFLGYELAMLHVQSSARLSRLHKVSRGAPK